ncbi:MAG: penicillin-insensitive murein endopeptidase [Pseudomonadota bacterium]
MGALLALGVTAEVAAQPAHALFGRHKLPSSTNPGAIGSYARGCLAGGIELRETAPGWQAMRLSRNRNWGHPALIGFIERLSVRAREVGWPKLYVGDIGQPRGGPMKSGHRSHQIGLDVDMWLRKPVERDLSRKERERIGSYNVVAKNGIGLNKNWSIEHHKIIRAAAEDPAVARIFVNAAIKRGMCLTEKKIGGGKIDAPWLRKVRPWKGHNYHFHVRLACPGGSPGCRDQAPPPPGNGCGAELAKWFPKGEKVDEDKIKKKSEEAPERPGDARQIDPAAPEGALPKPQRDGGLYEILPDWPDARRFAQRVRPVFRATTPGNPGNPARGQLTLADLPQACQAVLTDDVDALANLGPYIPDQVQAPPAPVFWDKSVAAHDGFIGTKYFWTPPVDLNAAGQRRITLEVTGTLPPGLEFSDRGGGNALIRGIPAERGTWNFTLVAKYRGEEQGTLEIALRVEKLRAETAVVQSAQSSLEHEIADFLTNFTGEECFLATPVEVAEAKKLINIEAFSDDAAPFFDFDGAFKEQIGIEANIGGRLVSSRQCDALAFARAFPHGDPPKIALDDPDHMLDPGQALFATITGEAVRYITPLIVTPDGFVLDASDFMTREGSLLKLGVQVPGKGPHLLVAVDTIFPLVRTDFMTPDKVNDIFANLREGNTARNYDMKTSMAYFVLQ